MKHQTSPQALHAAIIMDGNGRWALRRRLPRTEGHRRGARSARAVIEAAPDLGIGRLTLFAFSSDNWQRPAAEVVALMGLFRAYLRDEIERCLDNGVRLSFLGRRDRLDEDIVRAMGEAEAATRGGRALHLRIAIDYSARNAILSALQGVGPTKVAAEEFERLLAADVGAEDGSPQVDLLIRTGGEQRLSDFLLWECAYAELYFTPTLWPDFGAEDLKAAVAEFRRRNRRFGRVPQAPPPTPAEDGIADFPGARERHEVSLHRRSEATAELPTGGHEA